MIARSLFIASSIKTYTDRFKRSAHWSLIVANRETTWLILRGGRGFRRGDPERDALSAFTCYSHLKFEVVPQAQVLAIS